MTSAAISQITQDVQRLLDARLLETRRAFKLTANGTVQDADWLYVIVEPDRSGVHSEDYIEIARWVEAQIAKAHPDQHVLLVPAKPQD